MTLPSTIQSAMTRYRAEIETTLHRAVQRASVVAEQSTLSNDLRPFYGQIAYHFGWVDTNFLPLPGQSGKLLRPTLLLLAYEATGADKTDGWGEQRKKGFPGARLSTAGAYKNDKNFPLVPRQNGE